MNNEIKTYNDKINDNANDSFTVVYQTIRTKKEATDKMAIMNYLIINSHLK